ncbi:TPM domain-containing protein [Pedobacter soli]|uniref:TLP18.3, Psb32 and MOLO-1 founding protein of phosphatase n=1 Tax=Pedobacter soli TaxID=390242 RepID=A0A1G6PUH2_9SPHI|nr:TPM domain-containing protein [Pedobacter soli]SDC83763.1 TLP18.3, Psb32 and MOLO-1 founding protein of phosphatase [Pedobacter soli]
MKYILSLLLLFVTVTTFSQIPKPLKDTYVNDFAKVLSKSEIKKLNDTINQIEKKSGVQLALVIVNTIPKEYDIEEYSLLIARRWKVGNKEDGLVYVAAVKQRKQRLEVARNLEPIFTTETSQDVLTKTKAHFRAKDYGKGLFALVSDISFKLDSAGYGEPPAVQSLAAVDKQDNKAVSNTSDRVDITLFVLGFFVIVFVLVVLLIVRIFRSRPSSQTFANNGFGGYNNGYNGGFNNGYNGRRRSGLGSFFAGAATGYFANSLFNRNRYHNNHVVPQQTQEEERPGSGSNFGDWGSSRDSSSDGNSSSGSSSSSSSGGFSGGGASSDW